MPVRKLKPIEQRDDYAGMVMRAFDALAAEALRTCRGCGCDDDHACVTADGPCDWALVDVGAPTGVCSVCADCVDWDPRHLADLGYRG